MGDRFLLTRAFNPNHKNVDELRGRLALELLLRYTEVGTVLEVVSPDSNGILLPHAGKGLVFLDLGIANGNMSFVSDELVGKYPLIVDVHFPVLDPSSILSLDKDGVISEDKTHESVEFWSRPEVQTWARGVLTQADVLTTPHTDTYIKLIDLNPNVFYLPDVTSEETALGFCKQFLKIFPIAVKPRRSIGERMRDRIILMMAWPAWKRRLREHISEAIGNSTTWG